MPLAPILAIGYATKLASLMALTAAMVNKEGSPGPTPTKVKPDSGEIFFVEFEKEKIFFKCLKENIFSYAFLVPDEVLKESWIPLLQAGLIA